MVNVALIAGKIIDMSETATMQNGDTMMKIVLEVPRAFRNAKGLFDNDEIECILWKALADAVKTHAKVGSNIAIKGRVQVRKWTNEEQKTSRFMEFIAEKLNFIP